MEKIRQDEYPDLVRRLREPEGAVSVVLDTDTYNEIDDQFALAYGVLAKNINLDAVYAAPFHNTRSDGPDDGMRKSYDEILRILGMLDNLGVLVPETVLEGSKRYLPEEELPEDSPAAEDMIERGMSGRYEPLYVAAIGAPTNVASALLMEPRLRERIVIVWLGGQPPYWHTAEEFNLRQDLHASRVLFDSGVPLLQIPCANAAEHLRTTVWELEHYLKGKNPLGDYLCRIFGDHAERGGLLSKVIWDIAVIAWFENASWIPSHFEASPILTDSITWSRDPSRHPVRIAHGVDRDAVFRDLFRYITGI